MTLWFGEPWPSAKDPAPVCEEKNHIPAPVGDSCVSCKWQIKPDDQGVVIPHFGEGGPTESAMHLGCLLDSIGVGRALQAIANQIRADEANLPPLDPPSPITGYQKRPT